MLTLVTLLGITSGQALWERPPSVSGEADPPELAVRLEIVSVTGLGRPYEQAVQQREASLGQCARVAPPKTASGTWRVAFTIQPDGRARATDPVSPTEAKAGVRACVAQVLRMIEFEAFDAGTLHGFVTVGLVAPKPDPLTRSELEAARQARGRALDEAECLRAAAVRLGRLIEEAPAVKAKAAGDWRDRLMREQAEGARCRSTLEAPSDAPKNGAGTGIDPCTGCR